MIKPTDNSDVAPMADRIAALVRDIGGVRNVPAIVKKAVASVAEDVTYLIDEVMRQRRILAGEPEILPIRKEGSVVSMPMRHPMTGALIGAMASMIEQMDAPNYVSIGGHHHRIGRIEVIVQRVGALTPHTARLKAEEQLARAVTLLKSNGIPWDGPTEFLPTPPWNLETVPVSKDDWIRLDYNVMPNVLRCERCGARQPMPESMTADVFRAMGVAFSKTHRRCKKGDAKARPTVDPREEW